MRWQGRISLPSCHLVDLDPGGLGPLQAVVHEPAIACRPMQIAKGDFFITFVEFCRRI